MWRTKASTFPIPTTVLTNWIVTAGIPAHCIYALLSVNGTLFLVYRHARNSLVEIHPTAFEYLALLAIMVFKGWYSQCIVVNNGGAGGVGDDQFA